MGFFSSLFSGNSEETPEEARFLNESWDGEGNVTLSLSSTYSPEKSIAFDSAESAAAYALYSENLHENVTVLATDRQRMGALLEEEERIQK